MKKMESLFSARHVDIILAPVENGTVDLDKNKVISIYGYYDYGINLEKLACRIKEAIYKEMNVEHPVALENNYFCNTYTVYADGKVYAMKLTNNLFIDRNSKGFYYLTGCSNANKKVYNTITLRNLFPALAEMLGLSHCSAETVANEGKVEVEHITGEVSVVETKKFHWKNISFYFAEAYDWTTEEIEIELTKISPKKLYKKLNLN